VERHRGRGSRGRESVACGQKWATHRGSELVRFQRDQCARGGGRSAGGGREAGRSRQTAARADADGEKQGSAKPTGEPVWRTFVAEWGREVCRRVLHGQCGTSAVCTADGGGSGNGGGGGGETAIGWRCDRRGNGEERGAEGGVPVHGTRIAVCGDGTRAV